MKAELKKGDYVLASKYYDGHLGDNWHVGWFVGMTDHDEPRYEVADNNGNLVRGNGFRRAERITPFVGMELIRLAKEEQWERLCPHRSVWFMKRRVGKGDTDKLAMARMIDGVQYWIQTMRYDRHTTKCLMKSGLGQRQAVMIANAELKNIVLSKADVVEFHLGKFIKACRAMVGASPAGGNSDPA